MHLIAKNKIADYIEQHPEAKTSFLTWIKEFPYRKSKKNKTHPVEGILISFSELGRGDYSVKLIFNTWLKTGYIVWLGTKEAQIAYQQAEIEKIRIQHPNLVTTSITFTSSTSPRRSKKASEGNHVELTHIHSDNALEIFPSEIEGHVASEQDLKTKTDYENALNRAISIFDARPGTREFDELVLLLPLIRHYEACYIELPGLALLDVIKLKMEILGITPPYLTPIIGSEEEVNLFLTGKNILPDKILKAVCKLLYIRIPLNDKSLIK